MIHKWWVLTAVACGTFMATLDASIVNIALPTLTKELGTDLYQVKWVVIAYLIVITCLLLPMGRLSDLYGRKPVFATGFIGFVLGSALCGFAPHLKALVLFRVVQAIGAAMLMANGPAVITAAFPSRERGTALGTMAMVVSAGLLSGPGIGGFLISEWGWRSIFWVNIPVGFAGVLLALRFVKEDVLTKSKAPFDWAGGILQTFFLVSFLVVLEPPNISVSGSTSMNLPRWSIVLISLTFAAIFFKVESQARAPLFDLSLLRIRTFWTANLAGFFTFVAFSSVSILTPFFLEQVMHFPTHQTGLFMTAVPLTIFVVAPISGRLSDRVGSVGLSVAGALIGAIGLFAMGGVFGPGVYGKSTDLEIIFALCSIGLAMGLFQSPNNNAIMGSVPPHKLGVASALLATVRNLGLATGTGLTTSIFTWKLQHAQDFIPAFHWTLKFCGGVALAAMLASLGKANFSKAVD